MITCYQVQENSAPAEVFSEKVLRDGDSYEFHFERPGDYEYSCQIYTKVRGFIQVIDQNAQSKIISKHKDQKVQSLNKRDALFEKMKIEQEVGSMDTAGSVDYSYQSTALSYFETNISTE